MAKTSSRVGRFSAALLVASLVGCSAASSGPDGIADAGGGIGGSAIAGRGGGGGGGAGGGTAGGGGNSPNDGGTIPSDLQARLDAATSAWASAKAGCPTYSYDRRWQSNFPGIPAQLTEVEVTGDQATRRRYSTGTYGPFDGGDGGGGWTWTTMWDETGAEVGSHTGAGFAPSTSEQLFAECAAVLARNPAMYTLHAVFDPQYGVSTICTYRLMNCADDCTVGISLSRFACSPLPATPSPH